MGIIAISGKSGCGNTTVLHLVAEKLGFKPINYTFRSMAKDLGIPFEELLKRAEKDLEYDRKLDEHQAMLARQGNTVIGSRLAIWMVPEAELKVYLRASHEVRVQRIHAREGETLRVLNALRAKEMRGIAAGILRSTISTSMTFPAPTL